MDTISAFIQAQSARSRGASGRSYDYARAIKRITETNPKNAALGISQDWEWTATTVYEDGKWVVDLTTKPAIAGIKGSIWGTPTLDMDGEQEDCYVEGLE